MTDQLNQEASKLDSSLTIKKGLKIYVTNQNRGKD